MEQQERATFKTLDNGTAITYQQLLNFDGYINVHLSATNLATLLPKEILDKMNLLLFLKFML
jgi:hypothetical protein